MRKRGYFLSAFRELSRRKLLARTGFWWFLECGKVGDYVVEANALALPAVAYDAPGLRDSVKNNQTGLLAESGNVEDLACKLIHVLVIKCSEINLVNMRWSTQKNSIGIIQLMSS